MLKMQIIGHLGKDAEVSQHGTKAVINFTVAHSEKYQDSSGNTVNKTIWVSCAWWIDKIAVAQYLKKGTQIYAEGMPDVRMWDTSEGKRCGLNMRILNLNLLGGKKEDSTNAQPATNVAAAQVPQQTGYVPYQPDQPVGPDDLPF